MSSIVRILIILIVVLAAGGLITLAVSSLSSNPKRVEIVIPDDRFPR